jgi:KDO2-lipid IV(A) lauroyltransferase
MEDAFQAAAHRVPDRRFGGRWTRTQSLKNALIRRALGGLLFFADRLPQAWLLMVCSLTGKLAHLLLGEARARARQRVAASLPEDDAHRVARACFENAGKSLGLCLLLRRRSVRAADFVALSGESRCVLERALASGRGALVVSAHIGPFEMIPALLVEHGFRPAVVVRESYDPALDEVADAHRSARGVEVVHRGDEKAALRIARILRGGRPVGVLPDLRSRGVATTKARFLGRAVAFPVGVERLATRLRCPVVVGTLADAADGKPFELKLEAIEQDEHNEDNGGNLTQRVAHMLSRAILRSPEHWLWMAPGHVSIAEDSGNSLFSGVIPSSELGHA